MPTSNQIIAAATLEWCNKMRTKIDLEPLSELPKGARGDSLSCPCGKATGLVVEKLRYFEQTPPTEFQRRQGMLPVFVKEFVFRFDRGTFPDLIEEVQ